MTGNERKINQEEVTVINQLVGSEFIFEITRVQKIRRR